MYIFFYTHIYVHIYIHKYVFIFYTHKHTYKYLYRSSPRSSAKNSEKSPRSSGKEIVEPTPYIEDVDISDIIPRSQSSDGRNMFIYLYMNYACNTYVYICVVLM
jgi:hypothetical protein